MNDNQCSTGKCNKISIKCIIPVLAVFAVIFGFQWLYHGVYMAPAYSNIASMWRPEAEMQSLWWVCISTKLVIAAIISCLYCCATKNAACCGKCPKTGAKFGFKIGLLLGAHDFATYAWLPFGTDMTIPLKWLTGDILMGVIIGIVLSFTARICKKGECAA